jgi:glycosyltransferase involved in cell wall biosynthesis
MVAVFLFLVTGLSAALLQIWWFALASVAALQAAAILLLVQTRTVLSKRIYSVSRHLDKRISRGQLTGTPLAGNTSPRALKQNSSPLESKTTSALSIDAATAVILASKVFDREWYEIQVDNVFASEREACKHYLLRGRRSGFSPHPLFLPSWIDKKWRSSTEDPLVSYLSSPEWNRSLQTHPLFDPAFLDAKMKSRMDDSWGALTTFLAFAKSSSTLPYDDQSWAERTNITYGQLRLLAMEESRQWRAREKSFLPLREVATPPIPPLSIDVDKERFERGGRAPLVSVILPTWNRARSLRKAIESIQDQTYTNWELVIADDGSVDDTVLAVQQEQLRDHRIRLLELDHNGVSAARNAAIAVAGGEYIAFLDSDKAWDNDFLKVMLSTMEMNGLQAAASAVQITVGDRTFFRSTPSTFSSLRLGNSIDQTALVVRRSLVVATGGFDESLLRAVDYDLILSVSELAPIEQVQFVGVRYSEDASDPNRISEAQSVAWNFHVSDRRRWSDFEGDTGQVLTENLLTVIVDNVTSYREAIKVVEGLVDFESGQPLEVMLLVGSNFWLDICELLPLKLAGVAVSLVYADPTGSRPLMINEALRQARGETTLIVSAGQTLFAGRLEDFVSSFRTSEMSAAHPVVQNAHRLVEDAGVVYWGLGRDPMPLLRGFPLDGLALPEKVLVPGAALPLLVRTADALAVRGFDAKLKNLWGDVDFSQRIAASTGKPVYTDTRIVIEKRQGTHFDRRSKSLADIQMFRQLWPVAPSGSEGAIKSTGMVPVTVSGFAADSFPDDPGKWPQLQLTWPRVSVKENAPSLRWAIRTAAPADSRSENWGDFHFGNSLAASLRSLGQYVSVDYFNNAGRGTSDSEDIVLNLRGLRDIPLPSTSLNMLWVISHPDMVSATEVGRYHLTYAASESWSLRQSLQWGKEIRPLLQCTDESLFYPDFDDEIAKDHEILFVGNSREAYRPAPWNVAKAGLPIRIYGGGWQSHVDDEFVAGEYIPNDDLRRYYSSAGVTLNDHWADMREDGFISNRVFDVVASAGRLVTDDVAGLSSIFGPEVAVYRSPVQLLEMMAGSPLAHFPSAEDLTKASEVVRTNHSFNARARQLLEDAAAELRLLRP